MTLASHKGEQIERQEEASERGRERERETLRKRERKIEEEGREKETGRGGEELRAKGRKKNADTGLIRIRRPHDVLKTAGIIMKTQHSNSMHEN